MTSQMRSKVPGDVLQVKCLPGERSHDLCHVLWSGDLHTLWTGAADARGSHLLQAVQIMSRQIAMFDKCFLSCSDLSAKR